MSPFPAFLPETRQAKNVGADFPNPNSPSGCLRSSSTVTLGTIGGVGDIAVVEDSFEGLHP